MLITNTKIIGRSVKSLADGMEIARVKSPIVNYKQLKVIAYDIDGHPARQAGADILMTIDIREVSPIGLIVDSVDSLAISSDVASVKQVKDVHFDLLSLGVKTKKGKKLGKIIDFIFDTQTFVIAQLIVKRPVMQSLIDPELTISRDQIVEVNDYDIIIKDDTEKPKKVVTAQQKSESQNFVPNYVNPFKKPELAEEIVDNSD